MGLLRHVTGYSFRQRDLRLLFAAVFLTYLGTSISFPLRMLYAQRHGASPAQLGLMAGAFLLAPLLVQIPVGWLVDRWGRVPVLLVSLFVHPILMGLYIPFSSPNDLILLRFAEGITVSGFQPAVSAYIVDVTPDEHRSEAYGGLSAALNAGMFIGPLMGGLIAQAFGFHAAFMANVVIEALAIPLVLGKVKEPSSHRAPINEQQPAGWPHLFSAPLLCAYSATFCSQAGMSTLSTVWAIWVHDLGGSYAFIGFTFSVFALPQIFLAASAGRLSDRWGRAPVLLIAGVSAGIIYASYGLMSNLALITVVGVVEGIAIMFQQPALRGFLADASPDDARGRVQGMAGMAGALGGFMASLVALPLYHVSIAAPFFVIGAVAIVGAVVGATGVLSLVLHQTRSVRAAGKRQVL